MAEPAPGYAELDNLKPSRDGSFSERHDSSSKSLVSGKVAGVSMVALCCGLGVVGMLAAKTGIPNTATSLRSAGQNLQEKVANGKVTALPSNGSDVEVYFGCGCFWHVQHEIVQTEIKALSRQGSDVTGRAGYAGGTQVGSGGLVCYHNYQGIADYGKMGHAEVVSLTIPASSFGEVASTFWTKICIDGERVDKQDPGGEYRSLIGLPGGMNSTLIPTLKEKVGKAKLAAGVGNEGDTADTNTVYVYDTASFPAHTAERYHQFHDDMMDKYGKSYNDLRRFAKLSGCPNDS